MTDHLERASALADVGRLDLAEEQVRRHLAQHPEDAEALCLLARCRLGLGDPAAALEAARAARAADPTSEWAARLASCALSASGRYDDAAAAAQRAVELAPEEWLTHLQLASVALAAGRPELAWAPARTVVGLAPEQPDGHVLVGEIARLRGDKALAERAYRAALAADPTCADALSGLGFVHHDAGRLTDAARAYAGAAAVDPESRGVLGVRSVGWSLACAGHALVAFAAFGVFRVTDDDGMVLTGGQLQLLVLGLLLGAAVLAAWSLLRLPAPVRRSVARTARTGAGLSVLATLLLGAGLVVASGFSPEADRARLLGAAGAVALVGFGGTLLVGERQE